MRAELQLAVGDVEQSEREIAEIVHWRRENQPGGQNAGSVFVNPIPGQLSAGELIDRIGLRGFRIGGAFVSDKHANFIQAGEGATAHATSRPSSTRSATASSARPGSSCAAKCGWSVSRTDIDRRPAEMTRPTE